MMSYESEPEKRKEKQYSFCLTVYFLRMAFCKMSTVSVYKEKKRLPNSRKVRHLTARGWPHVNTSRRHFPQKARQILGVMSGNG